MWSILCYAVDEMVHAAGWTLGGSFDFDIEFAAVGVRVEEASEIVGPVDVVLGQAAFAAKQRCFHRLFLDVSHPGGLELKAGSVFEGDLSRGEILDVKLLLGGVGLLFAKDIARCCQNVVRFWIFHEPKGQIETMYSEIDERAAACEALFSKPSAEARHAVASQPTASTCVNVANSS